MWYILNFNVFNLNGSQSKDTIDQYKGSAEYAAKL